LNPAESLFVEDFEMLTFALTSANKYTFVTFGPNGDIVAQAVNLVLFTQDFSILRDNLGFARLRLDATMSLEQQRRFATLELSFFEAGLTRRMLIRCWLLKTIN